MHDIHKSKLRKLPNRSKLGIEFWAVLASSEGWFRLLGTSGRCLDGWFALKLAETWNSIFGQFEKKFDKIRVVYGARVSCLVMCNRLSIYRVNWKGKESEKWFDLKCVIKIFQIKSNFGKILIFSSICKLARNWQVLWAILDLKFDKNPILLKIYLVFIFYII